MPERPEFTSFVDGRKAPIRWKRMKYAPKQHTIDFGETCEITGEISINIKATTQEQAAALLHEWMHHIAVSMNMNEEDREQWVQAMEFQLRGMMRLNKEGFYWVIQNL